MEFIEYKTRNLKGAYLYVPEGADIPKPPEENGGGVKTPPYKGEPLDGGLPLVVWLTGGNDGAQLPLKFSLGKLLNDGKLKPECAVLMPAASYGHNYTTMTAEEMSHLLTLAGEKGTAHGPFPTVSICGWSLGADAAAILTADAPELFDRVCLISNYPKWWNGRLPEMPVKILVGANEPSSRRDWGDFPVERIPGYNHMIGDRIWTDERYSPLNWLSGKEG